MQIVSQEHLLSMRAKFNMFYKYAYVSPAQNTHTLYKSNLQGFRLIVSPTNYCYRVLASGSIITSPQILTQEGRLLRANRAVHHLLLAPGP